MSRIVEKIYRVVCVLENAADTINGILFHAEDGKRVAAEVAPEHAERFARIPGYEVHEVTPAPESAPQAKPSPLAQMKSPDLVQLLADHPSAYEDVEAVETKRGRPRQSVLDAVAEAKDKAKAEPDPGATNPDNHQEIEL